jgi:hypothetical protein
MREGAYEQRISAHRVIAGDYLYWGPGDVYAEVLHVSYSADQIVITVAVPHKEPWDPVEPFRIPHASLALVRVMRPDSWCTRYERELEL